MGTLGYYQSIESFALVDGPGVRSVLFLQGCPFRCLFCHNPDTWPFLKTNPISPEDAFRKLSRFKPYWKDNGGITVSGGEPLSQIDFLIELGVLCKENGVSFVIDTAGGPFEETPSFLKKFDRLLEASSLFLLDLKVIDPVQHRKLVGADNKNVLSLFSYLSKKRFPIWVRRVLVPGWNDDEKWLKEEGKFLSRLGNVLRIEVLPYHTLGTFKYKKLGIPYPLEEVEPPSEAQIKRAEELLGVSSASYSRESLHSFDG